MDSERILEELIHLLDKLCIKVKYDRGNFRGGLVKYHDQDIFYLNRKSEVDVKISTIINELKNFKIPEEFLSEDLKNIITSGIDT